MKTSSFIFGIILSIILGVAILFIINNNVNYDNTTPAYDNSIKELNHKIDSINILLKANSNDKSEIINKIDSISLINTNKYETFQKHYDNIVIGSISDDSITSYIASQIHNWQRYADSIHQSRK